MPINFPFSCMITRPHQPFFSILILLILSILACQLPQTIASTPTNLPITPAVVRTSTAPALPSPPVTSTIQAVRSTSPPAVADHRIATHRIYGIAGFYDQLTSQSFIPRGANYSILVPVLDHYENRLFGVGVYDHDRTQADFKTLSANGYNSVRLILDGCTSGDGCIGMENGEGLNPAYLDNIVDLMNLAKENDLFLLLASEDLPELGGYNASANQDANQTFSEGRNAEYLTSSGIQAAQQYWADLLTGLIARAAPVDIILGWELQGEQYYQSDQAPFSLEEGKVKPANGKTYDMSVAIQKQTMAQDGIRYYIDQVRQTILTYDPTALVTMGFFAPDSPNPWREGDERFANTAALLEDSTLDFFDFHAYPGMGLSIADLAQNFGLGGHVNKPILMGEVGANTWIYPKASDGAIAVQDWIAVSCAEGFSGWLYSGYYPSPAGLLDATWGMVDEKNTILNALSPIKQPDACTTTVLPGRNLALDKPVSVSAALPDQTPQMAVDGDPNTQWSAGAFPTQWIEIDLGAPYSIGEIRLTVGQWPAGETIHQLWVGTTQDAMQMIYAFSGQEYDFDVLNFIPASPLPNIRYVRIDTTESPSWVSWREIEVLAPFPGKPTPEASPTATP
jgi:hypothetical protein